MSRFQQQQQEQQRRILTDSPPFTPSSHISSVSAEAKHRRDSSCNNSSRPLSPSFERRKTMIQKEEEEAETTASRQYASAQYDSLSSTIKPTFQQLSSQQRYLFLTDLLNCCDTQILHKIQQFINPKLKVDFLKSLPIEIALHVLSFIDDPRTLTRASHVSKYWHALLKDDSPWKALCFKHQYYQEYYLTNGSSLQRQDENSDNEREEAEQLDRIPLIQLPPSAKAISSSYREFFRKKYNLDMAWNLGGGKLTICERETTTAQQEDDNQIPVEEALVVEEQQQHQEAAENAQSDNGLVTSLKMNDDYIVIGYDNRRVDIYDARNNGAFLRTLTGHEGGVWTLDFMKRRLYEGEEEQTILVTGGCDRAARVWDLSTGAMLHVLEGHLSTIRCCLVIKQQQQNLAVTGSRDTTLRIWDVDRGQLLFLCTGHQNSVRCLAAHGDYVASGSYDTTARLWSLTTGDCVHEYIGHHSQIYAITFDGERLVTGSLDSNIRIWSPVDGSCLTTLKGHTSVVNQLYLNYPTLVSGGGDGCLRIWDISSSTDANNSNNKYECQHRISAHDNAMTCFDVDEKRILSGGQDGRVKLWDLKRGTLIRSFTEPGRTVWRLQMTETKAVVVLKREILMETTAATTAVEDDGLEGGGLPLQSKVVIELHDFDIECKN